MQQKNQIALMKRMMGMIDNGTTEDAGRLVRNPTSSYICEDLAKLEWEKLFGNHAKIIGLSSDLPEPGDFITDNDLGIPILSTRDSQGNFRAFVNACRHRGAELTAEARGKQHRFACPSHAWTYANDGKLIGVR